MILTKLIKAYTILGHRTDRLTADFSAKFKFCGNGDVPDYILAIIHSNLCGLSSIKLRVFSTHVIDVIIKDICIDETKYLETFEGKIDDLKSAYACIRFLLLSAVRFGATKDVFSIELQQLGLPREHSLALGKVLDDKFDALKEYLKSKSLKINELNDVKCFQSPDGIECIKMELKIDNFIDDNAKVLKEININKSDIPILLKELKIIRAKMDELDNE
ncbi:hypothetical protein PVAND_008736 [Polypedilum vanderplanki]|uniref:COMM domain-containing protein 4 n=1 Tax=Polypedilum vanderplanki TaxID=319348 RepID=A0A9J6CAI2_POLVA|nr:hypothetical protein PVAND_008736 [Polypedilum vanderplanki]